MHLIAPVAGSAGVVIAALGAGLLFVCGSPFRFPQDGAITFIGKRTPTGARRQARATILSWTGAVLGAVGASLQAWANWLPPS